jgi:hypothetical protein
MYSNNSLLRASVVVAATSICVAYAQAQVVIAKWTFEDNPPTDLTDSATITSIAADEGTGTASGVHASAATDWTTPTGNGSVESLSSNTWAVDDYYQFSVSTTGYSSIKVGFDQTASSTGPGEFKLAYRVNGGAVTDFQDYTVLPNQVANPGLGNWNSTTTISGYNFSFDLSGVTSLNNASAVDFRLIMRSTTDSTPPGTVALAGASRIDNFSVEGTLAPVPEPETYALAAGVGLIGFGLWRRARLA